MSNPVIGMPITLDGELPPANHNLLFEWVGRHSMVASLLPFGITEVVSRSGVSRILHSRDFWQEWLFQEFILPDIKLTALLSQLLHLFY